MVAGLGAGERARGDPLRKPSPSGAAERVDVCNSHRKLSQSTDPITGRCGRKDDQAAGEIARQDETESMENCSIMSSVPWYHSDRNNVNGIIWLTKQIMNALHTITHQVMYLINKEATKAESS